MKKLISLILVLLLCLSMPVLSFGEIDLDSMSLDELVELSTRISEKIIEKIKDIGDKPYKIISAGRYFAGTDIAIGSYEISPIEDKCDWLCAIRDTNSQDQEWRFYDEQYVEPGNYLRIPVEENTCFSIDQTCYIRPSTMISFD